MPVSGRRRAAAVAVVTVAAATPTLAERWAIEGNIGSQVTRSSNVLLDRVGPEIPDTALALTAGLAIRGEGARLKLGGTAAVSAVGYLDHTVAKQVLPSADLSARLEAIDRLLYLEGGYRAAQTAADPFGARPDNSVAVDNVRTTSQWRFSPSLESALSPSVRYRLRSDNTWTREINTEAAAQVAGAGGYFGVHTALLERDPVPFGWRIELQRSETRYDSSSVGAVTSDLARFGVRRQLGADVVGGVHAGSERNGFLPTNDKSRFTWGADVQWQPSPRTSLTLAADDRFFGTGWESRLSHRQPRWALNVSLSRNVDTTPQAIFQLPATGDVAALLDAMFTTRFPDPLQRLKVVQDLIAQQGLPSATIDPTVLFAQRLSVVKAQRANLAFTGARSTLAVSAFAVSTRDALESGPFALGRANDNNDQYGTALAFSHRISALVSMGAGADWSSIRALESLSSARTRQRSSRVQLNLLLAPKTAAFVGARTRQLDSNTVGNGNERAIFVGAEHRL